MGVRIFHLVRGVNEYHVGRDVLTLHPPKSSRQFFLKDLEAFADSQALKILTDCLRSGRRILDEMYFLSSAAKRFDANRARAREQVQPNASAQRFRIASRQDVKQSFAKTIGGRPSVHSAQRTQ